MVKNSARARIDNLASGGVDFRFGQREKPLRDRQHRLDQLDAGQQPPVNLRAVGIVSLAVVSLLACSVVFVLAHRVLEEATPFDSDEAAHAGPALEMYVAARRLDLPHVLKATAAQKFYPPVHSFTVLPAYLLGGPSLATSRLPSIAAFAGLLAVLGLLTYRVTAGQQNSTTGVPHLVSAATIGFAATSPVLLENSVLSMLELLGALWAALLLVVCSRLERTPRGSCSRITALAVALSAISLTKYSFGLVAIPAVIAAMTLGKVHRGWPTLRVAEASRVLAALTAILAVWFLTAGVGGALYFAFDQPEYAPFLSVENLLFYPRSWTTSYSIHPAVGVVTALLACRAAIQHWNSFAVRVAGWMVLVSLAILTISLNNQPRHFVSAAPGIWFLAGVGLADVLQSLGRTRRGAVLRAVALSGLSLLWGGTVVNRAAELPGHLTYAFEGRHGERIAAMQTHILSNLHPGGRILFLGLFDQFNLGTLRWKAAAMGARAPSEMLFDEWPHPESYGAGLSPDAGAELLPAEKFARAATSGYYDQIVVIYSPMVNESHAAAVANSSSGSEQKTRLFQEGWRVAIFER